jgi:Tfp pilus assembly protein PilF
VTSLPIFTGRAAGEWVLSDRSFYLSVVGVFLAFGELLEKLIFRLKERRGASWALYALCACIILALAYTSRTRTEYWKDNITFWGKAHAENPANTFILTKRGMYHYSKYEIRQALDDLNIVVELAPEDGESFINRGIVQLDALDTGDALNDFRKAIRLRPSDPLAYYDLGLAFTRSSMLDSAQAAFSKTIELNPAFVQAFDGRANAFARAGNYVLALADYHRALKLNPDYADAYGNRAFTFLQTGNFQRALQDFRKQIELAPDRVDANIHYGYTALLIGDTVNASLHFSSALGIDSTNGKMYLLSVSKIFLKTEEESLIGKRLFHRMGVQ